MLLLQGNYTKKPTQGKSNCLHDLVNQQCVIVDTTHHNQQFHMGDKEWEHGGGGAKLKKTKNPRFLDKNHTIVCCIYCLAV